jgi:thiamine pyrophosphokinase
MKTLILCNGQPPTPQLFAECREWADLFIAADGGGNHAHNFESLPDLVIGDLDSYDQPNTYSYEIVFDPDQESNDLEKALDRAKKEGSEEVLVLGATGRRLDQTLKNLSVLKQFNNKFKSLIYRDNFGDTFLIPTSYSKELEIGTQISLFPLSGKVTGIKTEGLKYPLKNEKLMNGVRDGSSNEVISKPFKISYNTGDLLIFIARET